MKKLAILLTIFAVIAGCAKGFVKRKVVFTTLFAPGDTISYSIDINRQINVHEKDSVKSYKMKYNLLVTEKVEEVTSNFITITLLIRNASGSVTRNNEPFATQVFNNLKGQVITIRLTHDGSIAYLKGTEKIPTLLGTDAEKLSDDEVFSFLYDYIHPGELKPGSIYRKDIKSGRKVFRYEGIDRSRHEGDMALITFKSSFKSENAGYRGTYPYTQITKGTGTGTIYHLLRDGKLFAGDEKFTIKDTYTFQRFPDLNREVMVYTEVHVKRAYETGGETNE